MMSGELAIAVVRVVGIWAVELCAAGESSVASAFGFSMNLGARDDPAVGVLPLGFLLEDGKGSVFTPT